MEVDKAIALWILVFVVIFFMARTYGITRWSSFALAAFISILVVFLLHSPKSPHDLFEENGLNALYAFMVAVTYLVLILYILQKTTNDRVINVIH